jgi:hypothetical protein
MSMVDGEIDGGDGGLRCAMDNGGGRLEYIGGSALVGDGVRDRKGASVVTEV